MNSVDWKYAHFLYEECLIFRNAPIFLNFSDFQYLRCNFAWKWKEYVKIFDGFLLHHESAQKWNWNNKYCIVNTKTNVKVYLKV